MSESLKFRVEFRGAFYTGELYGQTGDHVYDLEEAAGQAERLYGEGWTNVYNGQEAITREEWYEKHHRMMPPSKLPDPNVPK